MRISWGAALRRALLPMALGALLWPLAAIRAAEDAQALFDQEEDFFDQLLESRMFDFATLQLTAMGRDYPQQKAGLAFLEARLLRAQGDVVKATAKLKEIQPASPLYPRALIAQVRYSTDDKEKLQLYQQYFKMCPEPGKSAKEQNEYLSAIVGTAELQLAAKQIKEAQATVKRIDKLSGGSGEGEKRRMKFVKGQISLDLATSLRDDNTPLANYKPLVEDALASITDLTWTQDGIGADAFGEMVHAQVLLANPTKALELCEQAMTLVTNVSDAYAKQHLPPSVSPLARLFFYKAEAHALLADAARKKQAEAKQKNDEKARAEAAKTADSQYIQALTYYFKVSKDFPESRFETRAMARFTLVKDILQKEYGRTIKAKIGEGQELQQRFDVANNLFKDEKFEPAGKEYRALALGFAADAKAPEAAKYAAVCLYRQERYLDAMAMADFMVDIWPASPHTPEALRFVAVALQRAGGELQKKGQTAPAETCFDDSDYLLGKYLVLAPQDPQAARYAARLAERLYFKAAALNRELQELARKDPQAARLKSDTERMRKLYRDAIPLFENVTRNYSGTDQALDAYYRLGWSYHALDELDAAARAFLTYCQSQPNRTVEKATAKFWAAQDLRTLGEAVDAIKHFTELVDWLKGGGFPNDPSLAKLQSTAETLLPWTYDLRLTKLGDKLKETRDRLAEAQTENAAPAPAPAPAPAEGGNVTEAPKKITPDDLKAMIAGIEKELGDAREQTLASLQRYADTHQQDADNSAKMLLRIGSIYTAVEQYDKAAQALDVLTQRYPKSPIAEQALFSQFRALLEAGRPDKAKEIGTKLIGQFAKYGAGNLNYIANALFDTNRRLEWTCLNPEVALAANKEIVTRSGKNGDPEQKTFRDLRELSMYRAAKALYILGRYEDAAKQAGVILSENPKSAQTWDVRLLRALAFLKLNKPKEAMDELADTLNGLDKDRYPLPYHRAELEVANASLQAGDQISIKKAVAMYLVIVPYVDVQKSPELGPVVEASYLGLTRAFALLGNKADADRYVNEYLTKFSDGCYRKEIAQLPAAKF